MAQDFIKILEKQAEFQSKIHKRRILPAKIDFITSFIGNYPWQVILFFSFIGAVIWGLTGCC